MVVDCPHRDGRRVSVQPRLEMWAAHPSGPAARRTPPIATAHILLLTAARGRIGESALHIYAAISRQPDQRAGTWLAGALLTGVACAGPQSRHGWISRWLRAARSCGAARHPRGSRHRRGSKPPEEDADEPSLG